MSLGWVLEGLLFNNHNLSSEDSKLMVGLAEAALFVPAARTGRLFLAQPCTQEGLTKASVSTSGVDVGLDGLAGQPPFQ